jgi:hypothetical protein
MVHSQVLHQFRQGLLVRFRLEGAERSAAKGLAPGKGISGLSWQKAAALVLACGGHCVQVTIALLLNLVGRDQSRGDFVQDHRVLLSTHVGRMQFRVLRGNGQTNHGLSRCNTVILKRGSHHAQSGENDRELHVP